MSMQAEVVGSGELADLLIILLLGVHLWAVNLACAGPLFGIWLGRRGLDNDPVWENVGRKLAWLSVWAMLFGMLTGGAQMVFSPSAGLLAALDRVPSRALWYAAVELGFSLVCLLIYAGCWRSLRGHRWWHASLALLSSTNLLYHFPPLMSVLGKLANDPAWASTQILDRSALLTLMGRSEVLALTTHFVLASLAVSAMTVLWLVSRNDEQSWEQSGLSLCRHASWVALLVTAIQLPVGIWLLVSLPRSARSAMMGDSAIASLAFVGALLLTFVLLQRLLAIAIGTAQPRELRQAGWLLAALVLLMTASLYESRGVRQLLRTVPVEENGLNKKTAVESRAPRLLGLKVMNDSSRRLA